MMGKEEDARVTQTYKNQPSSDREKNPSRDTSNFGVYINKEKENLPKLTSMENHENLSIGG
jgi:hypothetical protein